MNNQCYSNKECNINLNITDIKKKVEEIMETKSDIGENALSNFNEDNFPSHKIDIESLKNENGRYCCRLCKSTYKNTRDFYKHIREKHPNEIDNFNTRSRCNTTKFIEKASKKHNNFYDYSKVVYIHSKICVTIICPIHSDFPQTPSKHLQGQGCKKCGYESMISKKTKTREKFIIEANKIHKNKYTYDKVIYIKNDIIVTITCPIHGDFFQIPNSHLQGSGCDKCAGIERGKKKRLSLDDFIKRSNEIHKNKYTYTNVIYETSNVNVMITCPIHGDFPQTPGVHLQGKGCNECGYKSMASKNKSNTEEFIEKAKKVHGNKYTYANVKYKKWNINVMITCLIHGDFPQQPNNHLNGNGCPTCINKTEGKLKLWLEEEFKNIYTIIYQFETNWCINSSTNCYLPFDFCIKELKLIISLDGDYHYSQESYHNQIGNKNIEDVIDRDILKMVNAIENGYSVIRIPQEYVWEDKHNWKNLLKSNIKIYDKPTVKFLDFNNEYQTHRLKMLAFE